MPVTDSTMKAFALQYYENNRGCQLETRHVSWQTSCHKTVAYLGKTYHHRRQQGQTPRLLTARFGEFFSPSLWPLALHLLFQPLPPKKL